MENVCRILPVLLLLLSPYCYCQSPEDTLVLQEVILAPLTHDFSEGRIITSPDSASKAFHHNSVAELLEVSSAYIKSYGNGMLGTPSFRGTGAEHTAVLWNGFNINSPTLGLSDLSLLPLSSYEMEIHHGPDGAGAGTAAVGGAIHLNSRPSWKQGFDASITSESGSFGYYHLKPEFSISSKKIESQSAISFYSVENDFPYHNPFLGGKLVTNQNSAVRAISVNQNLFYRPAKNKLILAAVWFADFDREVQPSMGAVSFARRNDQNFRATVSYRTGTAKTSTEARVGYFRDNMIYSNSGIMSETFTQSLQGQVQHLRQLHKKVKLNAGADMQYYVADVTRYPELAKEIRGAFFLMNQFLFHKNFTSSISLKKPFVQGYDPPLNASLGSDLRLWAKKNKSFYLKNLFSTGYRVPTFNERFWPTGNKNLNPEKSLNGELSLTGTRVTTHSSVETRITWFNLLVDNWIQWVPQAGSDWTPVNFKKVYSRGIESSLVWTKEYKKVSWRLRGEYAYTRSTTVESSNTLTHPVGAQLVYVPLHKVSFTGFITAKGYSLLTEFIFTGFRYTSFSNDRFLPNYYLVNIMAGKKIWLGKNSFYFSAGVKNVTAVDYQNYENMAMPGRNYQISFKYNFSKIKE